MGPLPRFPRLNRFLRSNATASGRSVGSVQRLGTIASMGRTSDKTPVPVQTPLQQSPANLKLSKAFSQASTRDLSPKVIEPIKGRHRTLTIPVWRWRKMATCRHHWCHGGKTKTPYWCMARIPDGELRVWLRRTGTLKKIRLVRQ